MAEVTPETLLASAGGVTVLGAGESTKGSWAIGKGIDRSPGRMSIRWPCVRTLPYLFCLLLTKRTYAHVCFGFPRIGSQAWDTASATALLLQDSSSVQLISEPGGATQTAAEMPNQQLLSSARRRALAASLQPHYTAPQPGPLGKALRAPAKRRFWALVKDKLTLGRGGGSSGSSSGGAGEHLVLWAPSLHDPRFMPFLSAPLRHALLGGSDGAEGAGDMVLYRGMVHPDVPGLAFMGLEAHAGSSLLMLELQAQWLAAHLAGRLALPPAAAMRADVAAQRVWRSGALAHPLTSVGGSLARSHRRLYLEQLMRDIGSSTVLTSGRNEDAAATTAGRSPILPRAAGQQQETACDDAMLDSVAEDPHWLLSTQQGPGTTQPEAGYAGEGSRRSAPLLSSTPHGKLPSFRRPPPQRTSAPAALRAAAANATYAGGSSSSVPLPTHGQTTEDGRGSGARSSVAGSMRTSNRSLFRSGSSASDRSSSNRSGRNSVVSWVSSWGRSSRPSGKALSATPADIATAAPTTLAAAHAAAGAAGNAFTAPPSIAEVTASSVARTTAASPGSHLQQPQLSYAAMDVVAATSAAASPGSAPTLLRPLAHSTPIPLSSSPAQLSMVTARIGGPQPPERRLLRRVRTALLLSASGAALATAAGFSLQATLPDLEPKSPPAAPRPCKATSSVGGGERLGTEQKAHTAATNGRVLPAGYVRAVSYTSLAAAGVGGGARHSSAGFVSAAASPMGPSPRQSSGAVMHCRITAGAAGAGATGRASLGSSGTRGNTHTAPGQLTGTSSDTPRTHTSQVQPPVGGSGRSGPRGSGTSGISMAVGALRRTQSARHAAASVAPAFHVGARSPAGTIREVLPVVQHLTPVALGITDAATQPVPLQCGSSSVTAAHAGSQAFGHQSLLQPTAACGSQSSRADAATSSMFLAVSDAAVRRNRTQRAAASWSSNSSAFSPLVQQQALSPCASHQSLVDRLASAEDVPELQLLLPAAPMASGPRSSPNHPHIGAAGDLNAYQTISAERAGAWPHGSPIAALAGPQPVVSTGAAAAAALLNSRFTASFGEPGADLGSSSSSSSSSSGTNGAPTGQSTNGTGGGLHGILGSLTLSGDGGGGTSDAAGLNRRLATIPEKHSASLSSVAAAALLGAEGPGTTGTEGPSTGPSTGPCTGPSAGARSTLAASHVSPGPTACSAVGEEAATPANEAVEPQEAAFDRTSGQAWLADGPDQAPPAALTAVPVMLSTPPAAPLSLAAAAVSPVAGAPDAAPRVSPAIETRLNPRGLESASAQFPMGGTPPRANLRPVDLSQTPTRGATSATPSSVASARPASLRASVALRFEDGSQSLPTALQRTPAPASALRGVWQQLPAARTHLASSAAPSSHVSDGLPAAHPEVRRERTSSPAPLMTPRVAVARASAAGTCTAACAEWPLAVSPGMRLMQRARQTWSGLAGSSGRRSAGGDGGRSSAVRFTADTCAMRCADLSAAWEGYGGSRACGSQPHAASSGGVTGAVDQTVAATAVATATTAGISSNSGRRQRISWAGGAAGISAMLSRPLSRHNSSKCRSLGGLLAEAAEAAVLPYSKRLSAGAGGSSAAATPMDSTPAAGGGSSSSVAQLTSQPRMYESAASNHTIPSPPAYAAVTSGSAYADALHTLQTRAVTLCGRPAAALECSPRRGRHAADSTAASLSVHRTRDSHAGPSALADASPVKCGGLLESASASPSWVPRPVGPTTERGEANPASPAQSVVRGGRAHYRTAPHWSLAACQNAPPFPGVSAAAVAQPLAAAASRPPIAAAFATSASALAVMDSEALQAWSTHASLPIPAFDPAASEADTATAAETWNMQVGLHMEGEAIGADLAGGGSLEVRLQWPHQALAIPDASRNAVHQSSPAAHQPLGGQQANGAVASPYMNRVMDTFGDDCPNSGKASRQGMSPCISPNLTPIHPQQAAALASAHRLHDRNLSQQLQQRQVTVTAPAAGLARQRGSPAQVVREASRVKQETLEREVSEGLQSNESRLYQDAARRALL